MLLNVGLVLRFQVSVADSSLRFNGAGRQILLRLRILKLRLSVLIQRTLVHLGTPFLLRGETLLLGRLKLRDRSLITLLAKALLRDGLVHYIFFDKI